MDMIKEMAKEQATIPIKPAEAFALEQSIRDLEAQLAKIKPTSLTILKATEAEKAAEEDRDEKTPSQLIDEEKLKVDVQKSAITPDLDAKKEKLEIVWPEAQRAEAVHLRAEQANQAMAILATSQDSLTPELIASFTKMITASQKD